MTVVKKQFALVPPAANFTRLPMVGLASVEVSDKIENKQRVFVSKLAVFLPERFEVGNKKLCFRLRTVSGEYFMLGSGDRQLRYENTLFVLDYVADFDRSQSDHG